MKTKIAAGFLIALSLACAGAFAWRDKRNVLPESPPEKMKVRLGWVHQAQFAGMYMAEAKGFYRDAGLQVDLEIPTAGVSQTEELASGKADAGVIEAHQLLGDEKNVGKLVAVAAIYQVNPHALAARRDSGIRGPRDFKGKIVGLSGDQSESDNLFAIFSGKATGSPSVKFKQLGYDTVSDFINKNADIIDVYRTDQPYLAEKNGVPLTIIPLETYGFTTYGDVLVVSRKMANEKPDTVRRFARATIKGWEYALSHPDEAVSVTLHYTKGNYADKEYQEHILYESIPLIRGDASSLGRMNIVPWSTLYEAMRSSGAITGAYDLRALYTTKFIDEIL